MVQRTWAHLLGKQLNPTIAGIDTSPCGVFDLQVIPNDDPAKGSTLPMLEQEFLFSLEEALKQHANSYKVWNLSLGTDAVCSLDKSARRGQVRAALATGPRWRSQASPAAGARSR